MSAFLSMHPRSFLDGLKEKGPGLKQQLVDEITQVMANDPDVKQLIQQKTSSGLSPDQLHTDDDVQRMILAKTSAKVADLAKQIV